MPTFTYARAIKCKNEIDAAVPLGLAAFGLTEVTHEVSEHSTAAGIPQTALFTPRPQDGFVSSVYYSPLNVTAPLASGLAQCQWGTTVLDASGQETNWIGSSADHLAAVADGTAVEISADPT